MPMWDYTCANGHTEEHVRSIPERDAPFACACGASMRRVEIARAHVPPDGVYSYAPNIGDPERFERQREAIRNGTKVIPRSPTKGDLERWNDPQRPKGTFFGGGTRGNA